MIDRTHALPVTRQGQLLKLARDGLLSAEAGLRDGTDPDTPDR
jgi:hypothetical protein